MLTSIDITFPEIEEILNPWRKDTIELASKGVPPHISVLYPWIDSPIEPYDFECIKRIVEKTGSFYIELEDVEKFENGTVYFKIKKNEHLNSLQNKIMAEYPNVKMYNGEIENPVFHLTIAKIGKDEKTFLELKKHFKQILPIRKKVEKLTIMAENENGVWSNYGEINLNETKETALDIRLSFNEDEKNYDKWRPKYCEELFSDIIKYSELDNKKLSVEIGSGTGQATEPILETGSSVMAVEYGQKLADFTKIKFEKYANFQVQNIEFEKFQYESNTIDLVYSATAFHWIPEEIGYKKVYDMLKAGGTLALFWNKPFVTRIDDELHQKIQAIYADFETAGKRKEKNLSIEDDENRYEKIKTTIEEYGFVDIECHIYKNTRVFSADDYISLLNTYSDHRSLQPQEKKEFESEIRKTIIEFGGFLNIYDTMDLYLAKKPY